MTDTPPSTALQRPKHACRHRARMFLTILFVAAAAVPPYANAGGQPGQDGFLEKLGRHLEAVSAKGIIARTTADGILARFKAYEDRDQRTMRQQGFEYAIPSVAPFREPHGALIPEGLEATSSRGIGEILGTSQVSESGIPELFSKMIAPKKEDGTFYGLFVHEAYLALIASGRFRSADGTTDKQAVANAMRNDRAVADAWAEKLVSMERDGSLARLATAINGATAYADRHALRFKPTQVRKGLLHLATCISATAAAPPDAYADACNRTMTWMGERPHHDAAMVGFRTPITGGDGLSLAAVRWAPAYATEVYGPVFTDVQAKANDEFWRKHFELYLGTAAAREETLRASDSGNLLQLELAVGRTLKLLLGLARAEPFEGKAVSPADARAALGDAKRLKAELEATVGPTVRAREGYRDTMRGFEQVAARAKAAGIE